MTGGSVGHLLLLKDMFFYDVLAAGNTSSFDSTVGAYTNEVGGSDGNEHYEERFTTYRGLGAPGLYIAGSFSETIGGTRNPGSTSAVTELSFDTYNVTSIVVYNFYGGGAGTGGSTNTFITSGGSGGSSWGYTGYVMETGSTHIFDNFLGDTIFTFYTSYSFETQFVGAPVADYVLVPSASAIAELTSTSSTIAFDNIYAYIGSSLVTDRSTFSTTEVYNLSTTTTYNVPQPIAVPWSPIYNRNTGCILNTNLDPSYDVIQSQPNFGLIEAFWYTSTFSADTPTSSGIISDFLSVATTKTTVSGTAAKSTSYPILTFAANSDGNLIGVLPSITEGDLSLSQTIVSKYSFSPTVLGTTAHQRFLATSDITSAPHYVPTESYTFIFANTYFAGELGTIDALPRGVDSDINNTEAVTTCTHFFASSPQVYFSVVNPDNVQTDADGLTYNPALTTYQGSTYWRSTSSFSIRRSNNFYLQPVWNTTLDDGRTRSQSFEGTVYNWHTVYPIYAYEKQIFDLEPFSPGPLSEPLIGNDFGTYFIPENVKGIAGIEVAGQQPLVYANILMTTENNVPLPLAFPSQLKSLVAGAQYSTDITNTTHTGGNIAILTTDTSFTFGSTHITGWYVESATTDTSAVIQLTYTVTTDKDNQTSTTITDRLSFALDRSAVTNDMTGISNSEFHLVDFIGDLTRGRSYFSEDRGDYVVNGARRGLGGHQFVEGQEATKRVTGFGWRNQTYYGTDGGSTTQSSYRTARGRIVADPIIFDDYILDALYPPIDTNSTCEQIQIPTSQIFAEEIANVVTITSRYNTETYVIAGLFITYVSPSQTNALSYPSVEFLV